MRTESIFLRPLWFHMSFSFSGQAIQEAAIPGEGRQTGHCPADAHENRDTCLLHNLEELAVDGGITDDAHGHRLSGMGPGHFQHIIGVYSGQAGRCP